MAWKIINEARVVKSDETNRVGIMTGNGAVKVIGSGEGRWRNESYRQRNAD